MRSRCRLSLTVAGFAVATLCWAQDPSAAPQPTPVPSDPVVVEPTAAPQQPPMEVSPALPLLNTTPDAGQAPAATAPPVVNPSPETRVPSAAPAHEAKARRKPEPRSSPVREKEKEKEESAEAAASAATSNDTPANTPPADGTAASTASPAPMAASEALPPASGLPDPMANMNSDAAQPEKRRTAWIPIGALVLGAAGAITLVARRRRDEDEISILDRDHNVSPQGPPMPRHS